MSGVSADWKRYVNLPHDMPSDALTVLSFQSCREDEFALLALCW